MTKRIFVIVLLICGWELTPQPSHAQVFAKKNWMMMPQQATEYARTVIQPIITKHANNPNELPALRERLKRLGRLTLLHQIAYRAYPGFNPESHSTLAKLDYDATQKQLVLWVFISEVQEIKKTKSSRDFEDYLMAAHAHEIIHFEQSESGQFPILDRINKPWGAEGMKAEADAWGKTILEIIRPMLKQGRLNDPTLIRLSERLRLVKDDYRDPQWVMMFTNYAQTGGR